MGCWLKCSYWHRHVGCKLPRCRCVEVSVPFKAEVDTERNTNQKVRQYPNRVLHCCLVPGAEVCDGSEERRGTRGPCPFCNSS